MTLLHGKIQPNYLKADPAAHSNLTSGTAPVSTGTNSQRGNNTMQDNNIFYDEYAVDMESKKLWEADGNIRQEFHDDYESFRHFRRAEGQGLIKILGADHG